MRKLSIIGLFAKDEQVYDGQKIKTRIVTQELEKALGEDQVVRIDTYRWKKNPFKLFFKCIWAVLNSNNVMFITDEGGIRVFPWLLRWVNIGSKCRLHYYVVGGWLNRYLDSSSKAVADLKRIDAIYVELSSMLLELKKKDFENVVLVNKFRRMQPVSQEELDFKPKAPFKLCYFSRVMKEKGVEECIEAVQCANERAKYDKYTLDIYGSINEPYRESFENIMKSVPYYIQYKGVVEFQKSSKVLKNYFAMLFPTHYTSEGYPNVIVDAFASGVPVIATRWNYNEEIIRNYNDGILIDVGSTIQIVEAIEELTKNPELYEFMRKNCIARCNEYLPEYAITKVIEQLK